MRRWAAVTGGASAAPLAVLFALNLVDEFDRVAFGVLSPEIRDEFGLSDSRHRRRRLGRRRHRPARRAADRGAGRPRPPRAPGRGRGGSLGRLHRADGPVSAGTWVLTLARMGAGVGRIVNEPVHASLLTDYYAPRTHPRVFAVHRLANPVGLLSALVVGLLASAFDWRLVFLSLCVPTFLLLPFLLRLREPARGESIDPRWRRGALPRLAFLAARRTLFGVRTLRRLWVGLPVLGIALITLRSWSACSSSASTATGRPAAGCHLPVRRRHRRRPWLGQRLAARARGRPARSSSRPTTGARSSPSARLLGLVASPWMRCRRPATWSPASQSAPTSPATSASWPSSARRGCARRPTPGRSCTSASGLRGAAAGRPRRAQRLPRRDRRAGGTLVAGGIVATTARSFVRADAQAALVPVPTPQEHV